ncbi:exocyst complex component sec15A [Artemisia annua]|uniref:Exocyst complex component sec15A n=1 Tax=Artemisia annua TaxID=35608 RepID=A0A2U1MEZ7_ARTAN|nr:exocyst complex component sec15A [Artemisia annua]
MVETSKKTTEKKKDAKKAKTPITYRGKEKRVDDVEKVINTLPFLKSSTKTKKAAEDSQEETLRKQLKKKKVTRIAKRRSRRRKIRHADGKTKLEVLEQRDPDDPFIAEWESQYSNVAKITPAAISTEITSTFDADFIFTINFLTLFASTMGKVDNGAKVYRTVLQHVKGNDVISDIDWCGYILECLRTSRHNWEKVKKGDFYFGPATFLCVLSSMMNAKMKSRNVAENGDTAEDSILMTLIGNGEDLAPMVRHSFEMGKPESLLHQLKNIVPIPYITVSHNYIVTHHPLSFLQTFTPSIWYAAGVGSSCRWIGWYDPEMYARSRMIIPGLLRGRNEL